MLNFKSFVILLLLLLSNNAIAEKRVIKIATGSILEGYYSVGLNICSFIKAANKEVGCDVIPTNGSIENLSLLAEGKADFALVQSNIAVDAFEAHGRYLKQQPQSELRQVLNLYNEVFTIIAKDDDKIKVFADIAGKRISNGDPNSASTITYEALKELYSFAKPIDIELTPEDYAKKLCEGDIDAILLMVGHPSSLVSHIAHSCEVDFVAIERNKLEKLINKNPAFYKAILKQGIYPGITEDQETIGVSAILVTTDKIDSTLLKSFIEYFNKNTQSFIQANPILTDLKEEHFYTNFVLPKHEALR